MPYRVFPDAGTIGRAVAGEAAALIREAVAARGEATVVMATGVSQFAMLETLAALPDIPWRRVTGFHLDEYAGLPMSHPASFGRYLWERFVSKLPLPPAAFHYIDGENDPAAEARRLGGLIGGRTIDALFAGIGNNGHLAFNDPPADFAASDPYLVVELDPASRKQQLDQGWYKTLDDVPRTAISMSCPQIMKARTVLLIATGAHKAAVVARALTGAVSPDSPASLLQNHPDARWFLDPAAAAGLSG